jgi:hypothetical protein
MVGDPGGYRGRGAERDNPGGDGASRRCHARRDDARSAWAWPRSPESPPRAASARLPIRVVGRRPHQCRGPYARDPNVGPPWRHRLLDNRSTLWTGALWHRYSRCHFRLSFGLRRFSGIRMPDTAPRRQRPMQPPVPVNRQECAWEGTSPHGVTAANPACPLRQAECVRRGRDACRGFVASGNTCALGGSLVRYAVIEARQGRSVAVPRRSPAFAAAAGVGPLEPAIWLRDVSRAQGGRSGGRSRSGPL